jgi:hypothetical protein
MEREYNIIHWNSLKSKLKLEYPALTNSDLMWRHSTKEDLLEMIANKLGIPYIDMLKIADTL